MRTRFWIALLACATLIPCSGCGSCRWGRKHGVLPYQCVDPHCDDPACEVCSPVPPLYDGWGRHRSLRQSSCGCGGMACGEMPCSDGSCMSGGMMMGECGACGGCSDGMVMDGSCEMTGNSCGTPMWEQGQVCPHCHQSLQSSPQQPMQATPQESLESAPAYEPGPTTAPANPMGNPAENAGNTSIYSPPPGEYPETLQAVPMSPPSVPSETLAPEPPLASPTSGTRSFKDFFAPNKPLSMGSAPKPVTGPVKLSAPPAQWETSLEFETLEQASMNLPALP